MAQLFLKDPYSSPSGWRCTPLEGETVALGVRDGGLCVAAANAAPSAACDEVAWLVRAAAEGGLSNANGARDWFVLARAQVALNGRPLRARIALLADRDELRVEGLSAFVSFERQPELEQYNGDDEPVCPRCRTEIERNHWTVVCPGPGCGVRHHQDDGEELPCWLDRDQCALCHQPTALDAGFSFDPGDL